MSSLVRIKTFSTLPEAELAKGILEANGIPAVVSQDFAGRGGVGVPFRGGVPVWVDTVDAHRAQELLTTEVSPETALERRVLAKRLRRVMVPVISAVLLLWFASVLARPAPQVGAIAALLGVALLILAVVRGRRNGHEHH